MSTNVVTKNTIEDIILFLTPLLTGAGGTALLNLAGLLPGTSAFVAAVVIAALSKSIIGLGQDHSSKNWEDWLLFLITFLGSVAAAFAGNADYATYGVIIGFIAKSLPIFQQGFNIEDSLLFIGSLLALYGNFAGLPAVLNLGLLIAIAGKSLPSIATASPPVTGG